ncbi:hypothetical protein [Actinomadura madurae]|uniref:hypothetical protein n=1 Tax=Actinomadura madurae TaxID=1993 RepID=UPI0020D210E1|nr:hypothetical protein [Actinomadura madurae]MCP9970800.1 hypothetical protein [Actinomadura madurae]MCP9983280.1 hypothetical protein [Actinomadura madurae]MCQ0005160.1 hypothetical protein [Actinomadura madurae]
MSPVTLVTPMPNRSRTVNTISASVHAAHAIADSAAARRQRRPAGEAAGTNTAATSSHPTVRTAATSPPSLATDRPTLLRAPACDSPGAAVALSAPPSLITSARTTSAIAAAPMTSIGPSARGTRAASTPGVASRVVTRRNTHTRG